MDCKKKKDEILNYLNSDKATQIEKDSIKVLWCRRPPPYGIKIYYQKNTIKFE